MSDLISRSELIKELNKYCGNQRYLVSENIIEIINNQPNAYSVGKVIEELEMEMKASSGYSAERVSAFSRAIEIVKQVCVSDDVCEWHCDEYGRYHTKCHTLADNDPLEYTYCPYCGKKIKVVD